MSGAAGAAAGRAPEQLGDGILGRLTATIYRHLVVGALLAVGTLPTLVLLALLDRSSGNALLVPLCLAPTVPFLSAALFALQERAAPEEVGPAHAFATGLRVNTLDALRLGVPALAAVGIVATTVVHRDAAGISGAYALVLVSIALVVVLWALEALLLASLFSFRARDVARLALHHLASRPRVTVGLLALIVVAAGVVWFAGEAVLALVLVVWAAFLLRTGRPVIEDVRDRFVR